jgi:hypothetical protein
VAKLVYAQRLKAREFLHTHFSEKERGEILARMLARAQTGYLDYIYEVTLNYSFI